LFLGLSCFIVAAGVRKGIESFSKFSLPLLFILVFIIAIYSCMMPGAKGGIDFLVKPDFQHLTGRGVASALGQTFYSLSLGMGIVITYSSYVSKKENLLVSSVGTAVSDLLFACLASFAIMPAVFAAGIEPSAGPGLIFQSLPYTFAKMGITAPWASAIAAIFFFLTVLIAALTSAMSLVEVGVAYLVEEKHLRRGVASLLVFCGTFLLGTVASLSTGPLKDVSFFGKPFLDFLDMFCSNFLLLLGGLLAVLFVGWKMKKEDVYDEFTNGGTKLANKRIFPLIYTVIKYIAPIALAIIFFTNFLGN
jgi:NSS family neurotransmitter:Na+ symporter